jgi:Eco57I restriction endonuclease.
MQVRNNYTPDVLDCLANLSNDEVFTPPIIVNQMLNQLPQEIFKSKETTFLDPFTKSGVFLREITKRLLEGQIPNYKQIADEIERITKEAIQDSVRNGTLDLEDNEYEIKARDIGDAAIKAHPEANKYLNFEIDLQDALDHILTKQVFGIAITELTSQLARRSLYCSKDASGHYSICSDFGINSDGNIRFVPMKHKWNKVMNKNGTFPKGTVCAYCGAPAESLARPDDYESHAYEFIHVEKPEEIINMEFTVVCGNPPYQLEDEGNGKSAKPIYHLFVKQAKRLNPKYLLMIIPARWYSGGKGLNDFREEMLNDKSISTLVDYENYKDVFPSLGGLAGGVCYFLRDRTYNGKCNVINRTSIVKSSKKRNLNEFDTFIRSNDAISIVNKVLEWNKGNATLSDVVSSRKPFGLPTNYTPQDTGIPCQFIQRIGKRYADIKDVDDSMGYLDKWKLLAPKAPIAGQTDFSNPVRIYYESNTQIAKPGECCTESFIILGAFDTEKELLAYKSYIFTKTVRFLLLQTVVSQDITKKNFCFVPDLGEYDRTYTDEYLYELWGMSQDEIDQIESRIVENE